MTPRLSFIELTLSAGGRLRIRGDDIKAVLEGSAKAPGKAAAPTLRIVVKDIGPQAVVGITLEQLFDLIDTAVGNNARIPVFAWDDEAGKPTTVSRDARTAGG
jgi:hypothetical protein